VPARKDDITGVTKELNGGLIGLAERKIWLDRWRAANVTDLTVPESLLTVA
jgi:putative chitinase